MDTQLDRSFDEFTGALPHTETPDETLRSDSTTLSSRFAKATAGKREWQWLRMLERLHAAQATV